MISAAGLSVVTPDLLADLTPSQQAAATHFEGPLLILAGAGSGKTRVITRRIAWLLSQGVRPYQILAITFTNKAAGEMRRRVESVIPMSRVLVCTFHSLGARLLRQYAERIDLDSNFTIYDQDDRLKIVKATIAAANIDNVRFSPERLSASISKAKNALMTPDGYEKTASDFFTTTVAGVYHGYEKRMREANAVDFDDLLLMPALAMRHDAELRAELDSRFRYVMIDEYQDTNAAQYEIARRLSIDYPNICVVGDPDQSIYKWRGADIRNILDFERDFPNTRVVTLDRNYRSTKSILAAADAIIAHNKQRKPKTLYTENPAGEPVHVVTYDTGLDEAEMTVARMKQAHEQTNRPYRDFAVFLRINALSRTLESAFLKHGVPYQIVRGLAFYERKENRDVLAYLRLLVNPRDDLSFERAVNEPARGVGDISLRHLKLHAKPRSMSLLAACTDLGQIPAIRGKAANGLRAFHLLMSELRAHRDDPPDDVIRLVLDRSGYRKMLQESKDEDDSDRLANIEELITAAHQFAEEDSSRTITDFLEQITLASDVDGWDEASDCVSVMTLHAAKGLEFPVVSMLALEQGLLPHERSLPEQDEIEEERRLCYVGMTRAKEELFLSYARMREFRGRSLYTVPSMFLDELPSDGVTHDDQSTTFASTIAREPKFEHAADDFVDPIEKLQSAKDQAGLAVGVVVDHASYGRGKVLDLSGFGSMRRVRIRFGRHGEKVFVVEKAKLTVILDD